MPSRSDSLSPSVVWWRGWWLRATSTAAGSVVEPIALLLQRAATLPLGVEGVTGRRGPDSDTAMLGTGIYHLLYI
jgi:hypothetical protein